MSIKVGVVGIGGYAKTYLNYYKKFQAAGKLQFTSAVVRPQDDIPEVSAELRAAGVKIYPDFDSMISTEKLDLVALPIGIGFHAPYSIKAVKQGINVIVEKPAAGSTAEVDEMINARNETGKILTVGFQHIYTKSIRTLKQEMCSKKYGKINRVAVIGVSARADAYYNRNNWVCKERGPSGEAIYDSPINNAFAHYLNLGLFLSGSEFEKSAHIKSIQAELYRARRTIETFDSCAVRFSTEDGVDITTFFSHSTDRSISQQIRLECEKATAYWDVSGNWTIKDAEGNICASYSQGDVQVGDEMITLLLDNLNGKKEMLCPLEVAKEHTYCIENMHRLFSPVEIPESDFSIRAEDGVHVVNGIADTFQQCFDENKLPSELGVSWSVPQKTRDI